MTLKNHIQLQLSVLLGALALLMTGCSNDVIEPSTEDSGTAVSFGASITNATTRADNNLTDDAALTKLKDSSSSGFGVFCAKDNAIFYENQQVKWYSSANEWQYSPIKYWNPKSIYDYCAYAPYNKDAVTSEEATADFSFSYSGIPQWQDPANPTCDLMVSDNILQKQYSDFPEGIVDFTLNHKLAKFIIKATKIPSSDNTNTDYKITNVTIGSSTVKVPADGLTRTYTRHYMSETSDDSFNNIADADWAESRVLLSTSTNAIETLDGKGEDYTSISQLMVAPFTLTDKLPISVSYTSTNSITSPDTTNTTANITEFKPGYIYVLTLKLGALQIDAEVVELQDWTYENVNHSVYNW